MPGALDMGEVMVTVRERLPADAILTNGAGNFSVWTHRFYEFRQYGTQLAPTSGAMGYGVPAAIAAKIVHPERTVVCFAGDGDFLMLGNEMATDKSPCSTHDDQIVFHDPLLTKRLLTRSTRAISRQLGTRELQ